MKQSKTPAFFVPQTEERAKASFVGINTSRTRDSKPIDAPAPATIAINSSKKAAAEAPKPPVTPLIAAAPIPTPASAAAPAEESTDVEA